MNALNGTDGSRQRRTFGFLVTCLGIVIVLWFLALYPLLPTTLLGLCAAILSGTAIFFWIWASVELLIWLDRPHKHAVIFKLVGYPIACSLGIGVFVAAYFAREFLSQNFSYFLGGF